MATYKERHWSSAEHAFAIVDEVDSILIDEARTPLIISGTGGQIPPSSTTLADWFVSTLRKKVLRATDLDAKEVQDALIDGDYFADEKARTASLTAAGVAKAEKAFGVENLADAGNTPPLLHHINQAIRRPTGPDEARHVDYVVKDDARSSSWTSSPGA